MALSSIFNKVNQFGKKAEQERQSSPQIIQKTKAVRHPTAGTGIHAAYCKTDAGEGNILICYLDEDLQDPPQDPPPQEITVHCTIDGGGTDLNSARPLLVDGMEIPIWKDGDIWKCFWPFCNWDICT